MSALYESFKSAVMKKQIDLTADSVSIALVRNTYTFDTSHTSYATNIASHQAAAPVVLANKTVSSAGVFDADDPTFPTVASGSTVNAVVLYHTSTSTPIAYIDSGAGLPITTNGGDITINFSNATNRIFKL